MSTPANDLDGSRVLIVEDDALIAMMMEEFLIDSGCTIAATAASLDDAVEKSGRLALDAAVLDINLDGELCYPVAAVLRARGIPFVFATGYGQHGVPVEFADVPILTKPYPLEQLEVSLQRLLAR